MNAPPTHSLQGQPPYPLSIVSQFAMMACATSPSFRAATMSSWTMPQRGLPRTTPYMMPSTTTAYSRPGTPARLPEPGTGVAPNRSYPPPWTPMTPEPDTRDAGTRVRWMHGSHWAPYGHGRVVKGSFGRSVQLAVDGAVDGGGVLSLVVEWVDAVSTPADADDDAVVDVVSAVRAVEDDFCLRCACTADAPLFMHGAGIGELGKHEVMGETATPTLLLSTMNEDEDEDAGPAKDGARRPCPCAPPPGVPGWPPDAAAWPLCSAAGTDGVAGGGAGVRDGGSPRRTGRGGALPNPWLYAASCAAAPRAVTPSLTLGELELAIECLVPKNPTAELQRRMTRSPLGGPRPAVADGTGVEEKCLLLLWLFGSRAELWLLCRTLISSLYAAVWAGGDGAGRRGWNLPGAYGDGDGDGAAVRWAWRSA